MPFNHAALLRRRQILGFSQMDLAIVCGLSEATVGRIERGQAPNNGSDISIDTMARLALALQMEYHELVTPPEGNRYEKSVRFAYREHDPRAAPQLHDRTRSVKGKAIRRLTREVTAADRLITDREEPDEPTLIERLAVPVNEHGLELEYEEGIEVIKDGALPAQPDEGWQFTDQSSE